MKKLITAIFVSFLFYFTGCGEDVIPPLLIPVTDGAYILSEGTNPTNSKLSLYSVKNDTFY
ncbi:MAG TPA: hypothetical protein VGK25_11540, partial [Ignavibacteria bacterium]